jgi:uncharacterized membrane protein
MQMLNFKDAASFNQEVQKWVAEGIITQTQAQKILAKYASIFSEEIPFYKRSSFIVSAMGALIIAMGVILLISYNWERFPISARSAIGLIPLVSAQALALFFLKREEKIKAEIAAFFASLMLGANIFLQAQIYHISSYFPDGFLGWLIGVLPLVYIFRSSLIGLFCDLLFSIWLLMQNSFEHSSLGIGSLILGYLLWQFGRAPLLIRLPVLSVCFLALFMNAFYLYLPDIAEKGAPLFIVIAFPWAAMAILPFSHILNKTKELELYKQLLLIENLLVLYLYTSPASNDFIGVFTSSAWPAACLSVIALALYFFYYTRAAWLEHIQIAFTAVFWGMWLLAFFLEKNFLIVGYLANLLFLVIGIVLIYIGIRKIKKTLFLGGIISVMLLAIGRFIDYFENYLVASILFILCGLAILALNRYWSQRFAISVRPFSTQQSLPKNES